LIWKTKGGNEQITHITYCYLTVHKITKGLYLIALWLAFTFAR
jgi:hypothetical protein